jgi:hypothetical protein
VRRLPLLSLLLLGCGAGNTQTSSDGGVDLNDVSFLFPLPVSSSDAEQLLSMQTMGDHGQLFSRAFYDQLPLQLLPDVTKANAYPLLRVVAVRVDPCFPGGAPPAPACLKQIRLVAQPVIADVDAGQALTTGDATVHLFFDLSDADWSDTVSALWDLKAKAGSATDGKPLQVHPVMQSQGLGGDYATALKAMVTRHCGDDTLSRVAMQAVAANGTVWTFAGVNRQGDKLVADDVARLNAEPAQAFREIGTTESRLGELIPAPLNDDFSTLLTQTDVMLADDGTLHRALASALYSENPGLSTARTIDCASCHTATRARINAEAARGVDTSGYLEHYSAPDPRFDLGRADETGDDPRAVRAFGYLGRKSAFNQRTINDSAAVAFVLSEARSGGGGGGGGCSSSSDTWDNFAGAFFQQRCSACHANAFTSLPVVVSQKTTLVRLISSGRMPPGGLPSGEEPRILAWLNCQQ